MALIKPERLQRGDSVAIVSLSSGMLGDKKFIHKYRIAKDRLENDFGLRVFPMENALKGSEYLDAHPEARAKDLMDAFSDRTIKAVFNAIGGDDAIRLLPYVDFDVLRCNPKIFTGFSDTTTIHFMMRRAGLVSYYGLSVMNNIAEYVRINEYTLNAMMKTLFSPAPRLEIPASGFCSYEDDKIWWSEENMNNATPRFDAAGYELIQGAQAGKTVSGELLGGCVEVFIDLMGTSLWPTLDDWRGKLLLIETSEWNINPELLTSVLRNLAAQGIFSVINAIVFGRPAYREKYEAYKEVFRRVVGFEAGRSELPILSNVNVGHAYPIGVFPLGLRYELDCERVALTLAEPAVL